MRVRNKIISLLCQNIFIFMSVMLSFWYCENRLQFDSSSTIIGLQPFLCNCFGSHLLVCFVDRVIGHMFLTMAGIKAERFVLVKTISTHQSANNQGVNIPFLFISIFSPIWFKYASSIYKFDQNSYFSVNFEWSDALSLIDLDSRIF